MVTGPDFIELQHSCTYRHEQELSKGLSIEQSFAVQQAVRIAPGVSCTVHRNMLTHNSPTKTISPEHENIIQHIILQEHRKVMEELLQGAADDDSFWSLSAFEKGNLWVELVRKHNDSNDSYT